MKIFPLAPALPILFLACLPLPLRGSVLVDSLRWYTSSSTGNLTTTSDATVDPSAAVTSIAGAYVAATLPTTLTVTDTSPVTLSLTFRDLGGSGIKIGLFNNGGTAPATDGTTLTTAVADDVGAFIRINPTNFEDVLETSPTGTTSGLFYGTQTLGPTPNFSTTSLGSSLGTAAHTLTLSISLSGGIYTAAYAIDGVSLGSLTTTNAAFGSLNEVAFTQIGTTSIDLEAGSVTVVPEPPIPALLGAAGAVCVWARMRRREKILA